MMSPDNLPSKPVSDHSQSSGKRKIVPQRPPEQSPKCPRCDSPNTKFCYYNNYSLAQPRHFCKTCRRYWTKGGALRNVPIGGGCRKHKKVKTNSRISDDFSTTSNIGGLKFFNGFSPAMEIQFGRLPSVPIATNPSSFYNDASTSFGSLMGFNEGIQGICSMNVHSNLAASIESLSYINQDLHWKLQQQRWAMIFGGENQKESSVSSTLLENQAQKLQPISFQNVEITKPDVCAISNPRMSGIVIDDTRTSTSTTNSTICNWNGIQVWNDLHQYGDLSQ